MKRNVAFLIFICMLLFAGCATEQAVELIAPEPAPVPVEEETKQVIVEIRELKVPERDPFAAGGESVRDILASAVELEGRNPFSEVPNEVFMPEEPEIPEEPVEPGEDPGELKEPVIADSVQVQVVTFDRCWLDIFEDNVRVLRDNVPGGRTLVYNGKSEIRLEQVGREQAVSVTVNGKDLGRVSALVQQLEGGSYVNREAGVRITLEQRYPGGVLVGLRFAVLNGDN